MTWWKKNGLIWGPISPQSTNKDIEYFAIFYENSVSFHFPQKGAFKIAYDSFNLCVSPLLHFLGIRYGGGGGDVGCGC